MKQSNFFKWFTVLSTLFAAIIFITSCNKKFDEPPTYVPLVVTPTLTIADLKAKHTIGAFETITTDDIVTGVVVADDQSGNFYKTIVIQDTTGGITLRLDGYDLYTNYPVGRRIYIKLKGLILGDYNRLIQIGGGADSTTNPARPSLLPLASTLFDKYIIKGTLNNPVTPKVVTIDQLDDSYQSTLIQLNNFEFAPGDTSKTFGDPSLVQSAVNFTIKNCGSKTIILRNSSYANFAGYPVPKGNGSILSIYTIFGSTKQLIIRDTSDVQFYNTRCGSAPVTLKSISEVRALFTGAQTTIPDNWAIKGIVISDRNGKNINAQNLVIQNAGTDGAGILVRLSAAHSFNVGDEVQVKIGGVSLELFNGQLQVNGALLADAAKTGTGTITPRVTTVQDLTNNFAAWENTLLQLQNVTITGGTSGTFKGTTSIKDASGTIKSFTTATATFGGTAYPTGTVATFTGIASPFNTDKQLNLRNAADVAGGGGGGGGTTIFSEDFNSVTNNTKLALAGWVNVPETGTTTYSGGTFSGNGYAKITAFGSKQATVKSWLVTPEIALGTYATKALTFGTLDGYDNGATLKVYVSTNFSGSTPWTSTWTQLTATISSGNATGYGKNFIPSGTVDLSAYTGKIYIAFVYEGGDPGKTTTFEIDDVKVTGQ
jgi:hypothetical protein